MGRKKAVWLVMRFSHEINTELLLNSLSPSILQTMRLSTQPLAWKNLGSSLENITHYPKSIVLWPINSYSNSRWVLMTLELLKGKAGTNAHSYCKLAILLVEVKYLKQWKICWAYWLITTQFLLKANMFQQSSSHSSAFSETTSFYASKSCIDSSHELCPSCSKISQSQTVVICRTCMKFCRTKINSW